MALIRITPHVAVDDSELTISHTRSGGPGGQHANTSATKVELRWNLDATGALDEHQKARVRERLGRRITADGDLVLQSSEHRSQTRNKDAALARFRTLLADALRVQASRRPTKPTRAARQRRLEAKRRRGETKALRRRPATD